MRAPPTAPAAPGLGSLAPPALYGLRWKAVSQGVELCTRAVVSVTLARLLGPRELGLAGMALAFSTLGQAFADAAVSSAIVQRRDLSELDRSTAFWMTLGAGGALTALGLATSGLVADFFGEPRVGPLFAAMSCGFFIGAAGALPAALLARALDFRRLELCGIGGRLFGAVVAVGAAAGGAKAWAIAAQMLATLVITGGLLWLATSWRPRPVFSQASMRELGGFGLDVLGSRLFFYLQRNADNLLVGRVLGASRLGVYAVAYNLMMLPFAQLVDPVRTVLFPVLSSIQADRDRVAALWLRGTRALVAVLLPVQLGLLVAAPDLVAVLLGARWRTAVGPMQVLALVGSLQSLIVVNSIVLTALGHTRALLRFSLLTFLLSVAGFAVGLRWGLVGVAAGYLVATALIIPLYLRLTLRTLRMPPRRFASALTGVATAASTAAACMVVTRLVLLAANAPAGARLAAETVIGVTAAVTLESWLVPELSAEVAAARRALARRASPVA
jgi:O-antigen/teichoic acid export membrane protein